MKIKPRKHHYFIHYKKGDYISTRDLVSERYESAVYGSGMFIQTGAFDIHLYCTSQRFRNIKRLLHRNVVNKAGSPISFNYNRQTAAEYNKR
jgi:hypothetical protein